MASGLPVIAYDTAAAKELIADGKNGRVRSPGDATGFVRQARELACDPAALQRLGAAARATALRHAWPAVIARLETLFYDLATTPVEATGDENAH